jgi:glycosyltransferase involved in cell wall biosynthesis
MRLKMWLLRGSQSRSYQHADGVIFLTRYAQNTVSRAVSGISRRALIPHGVEPRFTAALGMHRALESCTVDCPFKLLYVSIIWSYKHQIEVARAVAALRAKGVPVQIEFVGLARGDYGQHFLALVRELDPRQEFIIWRGEEPHEQLHRRYAEADAFVFASSCENMPNILVEAMAAGLPIACSNRGPMPEVLGDAGVYFDPDSADAIATAIHELMIDVRGRARYAEAAALAAKAYSWDRCASDTFRFIREIYDTHRQSQ